MFTTLVESRAVRHRSISGTITSVVLHAAVIGAALALTVNHTGTATETPPPRPSIIFTPVKPPVDVPPRPRAPTATPATPSAPSAPTRYIVPPVDIPTSIPPVDFNSAPIGDDDHIILGPGLSKGPESTGPALVGAPGRVVNENMVDRAPQLLGSAPAPRYPNALRESGISGRVVIRFVIDTLGRAEMDDVVVVESAQPQFATAVKNVLGLYRFGAGEVGGRKVRTMVQMPFVFTLR